MARVTVEDCLDNLENRFELVLVASARARQLAHGKDALLPWEDDKPTVMALREIADGLVDRTILDEKPEPEIDAAAIEAAAAEAVEASQAGEAIPAPSDA